MARARTSGKKRDKRVKEEEDLAEESEGFFASMGSETIRGISGVALFVAAILLVLSRFELAGSAGTAVFKAVYTVVGVGYYLLPFMLGLWAFSLFSQTYDENKLRPIRATGAVLFFLSFLAIVSTIEGSWAGFVGNLVASPMLTYLDMIATLVVLAGLMVVSLLLLFDSELWMLLLTKLKKLVHPTRDSEGDLTEENIQTDESAEIEEVVEECADEAEEENEDDEDEEENEDEKGIAKLFSGARSKKGAGRKGNSLQLPSEYIAPPVSLLESDRGKPNVGDTKARANLIRRTLQHFKIPVEMDEIIVGPTVTRYSLKPAEGVKLSKIVSLQSNLELALAASPIRIEAPIPGRSLVGIEVPNTGKSIVGLAGLLSSPEFADEQIPLFVTLGKDIAGTAHYANIGKMPHLLVAGTTGSGKSVMIHSLITSLLYRNAPERLRFIMVDPKRVELTLYNDIPHLLTPVITDAKKCILALKWAAKEMDRRYDVLQEHKVQDIGGYHRDVVAPALAKAEKKKVRDDNAHDVDVPENMPHIMIVIDELADIMTAYPRELESVIVRLAQMSRAVGIHLVLSTQRPSVNVITGLIKANIPTRVALKVASLVDSRTILDQPGAEKLLGAGDMLYLSGDMAKPRRIQSPFLSTSEVKKVVAFLTKHNDYMLETSIDFSNGDGGGNGEGGIPFDELEQNEDLDPLYNEVRAFIVKQRRASTSLIQRRFKVGYGRAARIMDQLEQNDVITPSDGTNKPREILETPTDESFEGTYTDEEEASDNDKNYER